MALNNWSLDRLLAWIGAGALIILFIPMSLYFLIRISDSFEGLLVKRGESIANTLGGQITGILLLNDKLTLYDTIEKAASTDKDVKYICIESPSGDVLAHTFEKKFPSELQNVWKQNRHEPFHFQTNDGPLIDISIPIISGRLGFIHIGMSQVQAIKNTYHFLWIMGICILCALMVVLIGAHIVAHNVSKPLRYLEAAVSQYPKKNLQESLGKVSGIAELESLANGFSDMVSRLNILEKERAITQAHLVHTERLAALGELAAGLTHEIRNPLDGMLECVRYLEADENKGERQAKFLPMIREGLERINIVMYNMLTFAGSGNMKSVEICPTADIMNSLDLMLHGKLHYGKIKLTFHHPGGCKCLVNKHEVLQALLNLVLNAMEAAREQENPEIIIEATCDSEWVYLTVNDNGPGIHENLHEKIFEPFFTTKPTGKGTGLGLSISRQIVRSVDGELELKEKSPLGGAYFEIRVPRAPNGECCDD